MADYIICLRTGPTGLFLEPVQLLVQICGYCMLNIHVAFLVTVDVVSRVISVIQVLFVTSSN